MSSSRGYNHARVQPVSQRESTRTFSWYKKKRKNENAFARLCFFVRFLCGWEVRRARKRGLLCLGWLLDGAWAAIGGRQKISVERKLCLGAATAAEYSIQTGTRVGRHPRITELAGGNLQVQWAERDGGGPSFTLSTDVINAMTLVALMLQTVVISEIYRLRTLYTHI